VKIAQLIIAGGIAVTSVVGFGGLANAAPVAGPEASTCVSAVDSVAVPVELDGHDESVSTPISCDVPSCAEGALSVVVDDSGVQHQACVASAAAVPPVPAAKATLIAAALPGTSVHTGELPSTGMGAGGLVIAGLLVGCGSVASLVSRRRL
jgi:LPXTG-motif cell wall-anchored protein